jgi:hypothetical protein
MSKYLKIGLTLAILASTAFASSAHATSIYGRPCNFQFRPASNGQVYGKSGYFSFEMRPGGICNSGAYTVIYMLSVGAPAPYDQAQLYAGEELRMMFTELQAANRAGRYVNVNYTTFSGIFNQGMWVDFY